MPTAEAAPSHHFRTRSGYVIPADQSESRDLAHARGFQVPALPVVGRDDKRGWVWDGAER